MKSRIIVPCAVTVFAVASAHAQQIQPRTEDLAAPKAQQAPDQAEIPTRTTAPSSRQGEIPSTTTYTSPASPPVAEQPTTVQAPVAEAPAPAPVSAPSPAVAETNTTTTTWEELPGSASPYPSAGLGGLALIAAGILIRRKSR